MNLTMQTTCGPVATTGTLSCASLTLHTIEPAWRNNQKNVSCIPAGTYQLLPKVSKEHGQTWTLHNPAAGVWGMDTSPPDDSMRTEVEIHTGNTAGDSEACIIVGEASGEMLDRHTNRVEPAVLNSAEAMEKLRELLDGTSEEDTLTIVRAGLYTALAA